MKFIIILSLVSLVRCHLMPNPLSLTNGLIHNGLIAGAIHKELEAAEHVVHGGLNLAHNVINWKLGAAESILEHLYPHYQHHHHQQQQCHHYSIHDDNNPSISDYYNVYNSRNFTGKTALITLTNSGIGEASAVLLSILGANLVITSTNSSQLETVAEVVQRLSPHNRKLLTVVADLTKTENIKRLLAQTVLRFGRLDTLVVFAASYPLLNITDNNVMENWDLTFNHELRSTAELTHLAVPLLEQTNGTITIVATIAGSAPVAVELAYSTSKAGINQMSRILAMELGSKHIRVNTINLGAVYTGVDNPVLDLMKSKTPLGRLGDPLDIAKGVAFLSSTDASYITGANLVIDGGIIYNYPAYFE